MAVARAVDEAMLVEEAVVDDLAVADDRVGVDVGSTLLQPSADDPSGVRPSNRIITMTHIAEAAAKGKALTCPSVHARQDGRSHSYVRRQLLL